MSAATIHRKHRPPLERATGFVRLDVGTPATLQARLALIVRAYHSERPVACGCRDCDYTIPPGELFTMGNQRDSRGKYARCYVCMPFESVKGA